MHHKKDMTVELIKRISGQQAVLTIPKVYLDMLDGDIKTSLFLSQVIYWSDKGSRTDGWFYKSDKEWCHELSLSEYECKKSRDKLSSLGLLIVEKKKANGVPTMHYKIQWDNLSKWVSEKFNNRQDSVFPENSVSENFGEGDPKNSETHSLKTPESLTEITNRDYDKEKDIKDSLKSTGVTKPLFDMPASIKKESPSNLLASLKGKAKHAKKIQLVAEGDLSPTQLDDLDICFYFAQKHKEILGYEVPYQKEQYMSQFRDNYSLSIGEAYTIVPAVLAEFRKMCEQEKRRKADWSLKIGWLIYDAPSDVARIMDKVKPKVNEKYLAKDEPTVSNPHRIVDEIF